MVKIPYEQIVEKIKDEKGLTEEDIQQKIKEKMDKLSGLISKEGAAFIIANELGVKLAQASGKVKIKDILTGMRNIETAAKVMRKFPVHEFERNGSKGKVQSLIIADETGETRLTCWHDQVEALTQINEGDVIKIMNAYVRDNNGNAEVHMNAQSKIVVNPSDVTIGEVKSNVTASTQGAPAPASGNRKMIKELSEADQNVEIFGTIVQVFEPRFYAVCPECNRKVSGNDGVYSCATHGDVDPAYSYVMNVFVDDGSDNVRAVFFKNQAQALLKKEDSEIVKFRESPEQFEAYKTALLGEQVKILGRVQKNTMFDRLEIISSQVFMDIDPEDEIKKLKENFPDASAKAEDRMSQKSAMQENADAVTAKPAEVEQEKPNITEPVEEENPADQNETVEPIGQATQQKEETPDSIAGDDLEAEKPADPVAEESSGEKAQDETIKGETSGVVKELKSEPAMPSAEDEDEDDDEDLDREEENVKVSSEAGPVSSADDESEGTEKKKEDSAVSDDEIEDLLGEIENTPSIDDI